MTTENQNICENCEHEQKFHRKFGIGKGGGNTTKCDRKYCSCKEFKPKTQDISQETEEQKQKRIRNKPQTQDNSQVGKTERLAERSSNLLKKRSVRNKKPFYNGDPDKKPEEKVQFVGRRNSKPSGGLVSRSPSGFPAPRGIQ